MHFALALLLGTASAVSAAAIPNPLYPYLRARAAAVANVTGGLSELPIYDSPPETKAPKNNVWAPISPQDNADVWDLLHSPDSGLNLTAYDDATQADNYVFFIDTLPQNKSAVLPYITGDGPEPPKYARAVIFEGARPEPRSQEYMIGPLPVSSETRIEQWDYAYNGGRGGAVPFNERFFDEKRYQAAGPYIIDAMTTVADITTALFGRAFYGPDDERTNLSIQSGTPIHFDSTQTILVIMFRHAVQSAYLQPIDFYLLFDAGGTDSSQYSILGVVTKERFFETEPELRAAFEAGELTQEYPQQEDATWTLMDLKEDMGTRDLDERFAPVTLALGGKRYRFDPEQRYFEYLGWSFYYSYVRTLGVMLYDIRFKGERIMYELSMQESTAQYGGNQPKAASTLYQDTHFSMGAQAGTLLEGFDCPFGATMLDLQVFAGNSTVNMPNALCVFESTPNAPLSRHRYEIETDNTDWDFSRLAVVKDSFLTVRSICTIGNYDFILDYSFHADGSIQVDVRASGFLQASPYYPDQAKWGPRIQQGTQGSYHDHVISYKADFDILGTANSFQMTKVVTRNQTQPWFKQLGKFAQMELETSVLEVEERINYSPNGETMYCVINEDEKNQWGVARGYRIIPGRTIHLAIMDSPFSYRNAEFTKQHLAVSRQHDTEPLATSFQVANAPNDPQQDFSKFFDDEPIRQEDLVVWFNLGMHHFTRSEDVPVTLSSEAHSSILFSPQNFFDKSQDGDLQNRRWVVVNQNDELDSTGYGVPLPDGLIRLREPTRDLRPDEYLL